MAAVAAGRQGPAAWHALGTTRREVCLDLTLPTGQSFRWVRRAGGVWAGVVGGRVVALRQQAGGEGDVEFALLNAEAGAGAGGAHGGSEEEAARAALRDYFHLETASLADLYAQFEKADDRFSKVAPYFGGCRMLRQDPTECLFSFICSSNNHISRIHGMVNRLCATYGERLPLDACAEALLAPPEAAGDERAKKGGSAAKGGGLAAESLEFFSFPTVEQLLSATEEDLRAAGFGYRAKFVTGSAAALAAQPGGGAEYLMRLRGKPRAEACAELEKLPGIGPKVAACVALFSLDAHATIPVDTHVWQIAIEHYTPELADKSLTPKVHGAINDAFESRFGPYSGWAHNVLFVSHLREYNKRLPEHLQSPPTPSPNASAKKRKAHKAKRAANGKKAKGNDTAPTRKVKKAPDAAGEDASVARSLNAELNAQAKREQ